MEAWWEVEIGVIGFGEVVCLFWLGFKKGEMGACIWVDRSLPSRKENSVIKKEKGDRSEESS